MYTRKLYYKHFTPACWLKNNLCEFTAREHNSKGDFVLINRFEAIGLKSSGIQNKNGLRFGMTNSIDEHLRLTKSESKYISNKYAGLKLL